MSTICGLFSKKGCISKYNTSGLFQKSGIYTHDTASIWQNESVFLGCNLKKIVPESEYETLPYFDKESKLIITADAIIDNRDELSDLLDLKDDKNTSDSKYILEAYKKWGYNCPEYLIGDFAFAIWDDRKKELYCCRDHVGKHPIYYYNSGVFFCFSTLIKPILQIDTVIKMLDETYIADYLSWIGPGNQTEGSHTIYKNIFQFPPASYMIVRPDSLKLMNYWKMEKTDEFKYKTDSEYENAFIDVFSKAVKCRTRTEKNVGIKLSGGLDSGAVASIAAPILKENNKNLYSYTQIPFEDYIEWLPKNRISNESVYVNEYNKIYKNIKSKYLSCEGKDSISNIDEQISVFEQPYKTFENLIWVTEIMKEAARDNVGIMLTGVTGNYSISWGNFFNYMKYLTETGNIKEYIKEIIAYSRRNNRKIHRVFARTILNSLKGFIIRSALYSKKKEDFILNSSLINKSFYRKMRVFERFERNNVFNKRLTVENSLERRLIGINFNMFSRTGCLGKKISLKYGIENRDPTRDKRVIQFCLNLPENQYVRNGEERRFIRHAMKGIMPDKIRLNYDIKGLQSTDSMQRINNIWKKTYMEINQIGTEVSERKYLNIEKIKSILPKYKDRKFIVNNDTDLKMLIRALIFSSFLRKHNFITKGD